jgi:putative hydrolase of the HAD superfamily
MTEPGLPELFRTLKASGKLIAVICNTNTTDGVIVHEALAHHGLASYLDEEIYSNEIGVAKPDPRIFAALAQRFPVDREQIVHVGDNPITDVQGATASGFGAILYDRRQRVPQSSGVIWHHDDLPLLLG